MEAKDPKKSSDNLPPPEWGSDPRGNRGWGGRYGTTVFVLGQDVSNGGGDYMRDSRRGQGRRRPRAQHSSPERGDRGVWVGVMEGGSVGGGGGGGQ